ncbi:MAG: NusG domain II-containing protein [Eubacterium sp.]|nr:NusG domain II-containing protein [Eubacterium sp.]
MKKNDLRLILAILIAALALFAAFFVLQGPHGKKSVRVSQEGRIVATYALDEDRTETFTSDLGTNTLVISGGTASIVSADCDNQVCVNTAPISEIGETIACLPHKLIVEIISEN